jgi:hypothetical protein
MVTRKFNFIKSGASLLLLFLTVQAYEDSRLCIAKYLDYIKETVLGEICRIPMNQLDGKQCSYDWVIRLKKEDIRNLPDSSVVNIRSMANRFYYLFPGNIGKKFVNDSFVIDLNIAILCDSTMPISKRVQAFDFLIERTSDGVILPHKKRIAPFINLEQINLSSKAEMASLLKFSNKEIDAAFKKGHKLPLKVQARLGITDASNRLIEAFDNANGYEAKEIAMKALLFTGQLDAIRHVITKCADSVFEMEGSCIKTTLQYEVLQALSYYHAGDPVIENELSAAFNAAAYRNDTATVRAYFDRVYEWMYRNYRVKPEKTPPVLFFQQPCIR